MEQNATVGDIAVRYFTRLFRVSFLCTLIFFVLYPFYNEFYNGVISKYFYNNDALYFTVTFEMIHCVLYWTINSFFLFCDFNHLLLQYKLPRLRYQIPDKNLIIKTIKSAIISQLTAEPIGTYFVLFPLLIRNGMVICYDAKDIMHRNILNWDLITFLQTMAIFALCDMGNEWLFYIAHRILHHPKLYGIIHKQHHEYKGTIGFAAEYAHPIESVAANHIPTLFGVTVTGAHPLIIAIFLVFRLEETYEAHSGYSFYNTFLHKIGFTHANAALFHDFHHSRNTGNYGAPEIDAIFGTDNGWTEWLEKWLQKYHPKQL